MASWPVARFLLKNCCMNVMKSLFEAQLPAKRPLAPPGPFTGKETIILSTQDTLCIMHHKNAGIFYDQY